MSAIDQIPGLAGYYAAEQQNQQRGMQQLQMAQTAQTLQQHFNHQAEMQKAKEIIQTEKDPEQVITSLASIGPTGAAMAKQYAEALKASQQVKTQKALMEGAGPNANLQDPEFLRRMGLATGKPELITHAERIEQQRRNEATLGTMRSQPQDMPAGTHVPGTTMQTAQAIPAAERPAFDRVAAASANGQTMTSGQQPGDQAPTDGGLFSTLAQSQVPQIASQAKVLQQRLEQSGNTIPAQHWQDMQARLAAQEATYLNRQQPLVATAGPNGPVLTPRNQAAGMTPASAGTNPSAALDTDAVDQAAARYRIDGSLPTNLGRGTQGAVNTTKILNRAAELSKEDGDSPEAARLQQIAGKAGTQALGQLEKQKNLVVAFEKNAFRNADLVLQESEKVDRLGSPVIDRWIQSGKKNIAGDVAVARLDTAVRTLVNEYARVTTSVTGGGVTSDTARKEIDELLRGAHTKDQVRQVVDLMKTEMENRRLAYEDQSTELKRSIQTRGKESPQTPADAREVKLPDGRVKRFPTPAAASAFRKEAGL